MSGQQQNRLSAQFLFPDQSPSDLCYRRRPRPRCRSCPSCPSSDMCCTCFDHMQVDQSSPAFRAVCIPQTAFLTFSIVRNAAFDAVLSIGILARPIKTLVFLDLPGTLLSQENRLSCQRPSKDVKGWPEGTPAHYRSLMATAESVLEVIVGAPFLLTALAVFAALIYWCGYEHSVLPQFLPCACMKLMLHRDILCGRISAACWALPIQTSAHCQL